MKTKYKVGDIVRIKNREWYDLNKNSDDNVIYTIIPFDRSQAKYCGKEAKIIGACVVEYMKDKRMLVYYLDIDNKKYEWTEEMFDENHISEKSSQDQKWAELSDKERENIKHIYNEHPEWEDVRKALEVFGKHNLQLEPKIKTWKGVEKSDPEHFNHSNAPNPMLISSQELRDKLLNKSIAIYKIATLIELGYGGIISEEEWENEAYEGDGFYAIAWNPLYKSFHIKYETNSKSFLSFRSRELAEEFMHYPENVELLRQYNML